jgi:hypothetical protein
MHFVPGPPSPCVVWYPPKPIANANSFSEILHALEPQDVVRLLVCSTLAHACDCGDGMQAKAYGMKITPMVHPFPNFPLCRYSRRLFLDHHEPSEEVLASSCVGQSFVVLLRLPSIHQPTRCCSITLHRQYDSPFLVTGRELSILAFQVVPPLLAPSSTPDLTCSFIRYHHTDSSALPIDEVAQCKRLFRHNDHTNDTMARATTLGIEFEFVLAYHQAQLHSLL